MIDKEPPKINKYPAKQPCAQLKGSSTIPTGGAGQYNAKKSNGIDSITAVRNAPATDPCISNRTLDQDPIKELLQQDLVTAKILSYLESADIASLSKALPGKFNGFQETKNAIRHLVQEASKFMHPYDAMDTEAFADDLVKQANDHAGQYSLDTWEDWATRDGAYRAWSKGDDHRVELMKPFVAILGEKATREAVEYSNKFLHAHYDSECDPDSSDDEDISACDSHSSDDEDIEAMDTKHSWHDQHAAYQELSSDSKAWAIYILGKSARTAAHLSEVRKEIAKFDDDTVRLIHRKLYAREFDGPPQGPFSEIMEKTMSERNLEPIFPRDARDPRNLQYRDADRAMDAGGLDR